MIDPNHDLAYYAMTRNQNVVDSLTYWQIWEENGRDKLKPELKLKTEAAVKRLNRQLRKNEQYLEQLDVLENEADLALNSGVENYPETARAIKSKKFVRHWSVEDKIFFELEETTNRLIPKEPFIHHFYMEGRDGPRVSVELNAKRIKAAVVDKEGHKIREPRNHVYLKFVPSGMTERDEMEMVVEFYNKTTKQNVVDFILIKNNKREERIYLRKMLKTKKAIDYGKSNSLVKYVNVAIGVRRRFGRGVKS
ncbi:Oidioi.mRNA.OKI2018_I69.PAR.g10911.t1.cds [Oikopleura dioica]|uniref:Oidioi.mRNA.OKI2018_I69.PAR.g10911.t1.cds n=1 Tax=Oikopleura dioica TaxID=34765 RepID=A0ABN7RX16_OIKDI|nr:Oidioi.mRNA.OKI2018_I69.PAR.g10911.t1.cds [Oikopleura dioica]